MHSLSHLNDFKASINSLVIQIVKLFTIELDIMGFIISNINIIFLISPK